MRTYTADEVDAMIGKALARERERVAQQEGPVPIADNTYSYAKSLAEAIFKQHFASDEHYSSGRIVWGVNDTVIGILTQIDNMVADMVRRPAQVDGDTIVQTFTGLPRRKLRDLLSGGWEVNGVCFQRTETDGTVRRGAATTGGMVLWWNAEQPAQQEPKKDLMYSTVAMQERHAAFVDRAVATLEQAKRKALAERPAVSAGPITPAMMQGPTPEQKSQMVAAMSKLAEPPAQQEPVAWRVWRGDAYELFFSKYAADRRADCFTKRPDVEPLYTSPQAQQQQQEPVAVKQIAEALRKHGLTLVKTTHNYHVMDLGRIEAQTTSPPIEATPLASQRSVKPWVGLTDEDIDQGLLRSDYAFKTAEAWRAGVVFAMTKLKEKNT